MDDRAERDSSETTERFADDRRASVGDVAVLLFDLARVLRRAVPPSREYRIPNVAADIMMVVLAAPGITVGELARTTGVKLSNTSSTVSMLVGRAMLEKRVEGREARLFPTERARRITQELRETWTERLERVPSTLEELRAIATYLQRAIDLLGDLPEPAGDSPGALPPTERRTS